MKTIQSTILLGLAMASLLPFANGQTETGILTPVWSLAPGDRTYITNSHTERDIGFSPVTGHVLVPSRASGAVQLFVLDGDTGAEVTQMDTFNVFGGDIWLNHVDVAEDGVIYGANVVNNPNALAFKIYRWEDEGAFTGATTAYEGSMGGVDQRWGDTFAVRGSGTNTQILVSSLDSNDVAVFTTADGVSFTPTIMSVTGATARAFAHGIAFGQGDTFWGKTGNGSAGTVGTPLRHVSFDLTTATASVLQEYPNSLPVTTSGPIAVDVTNNLLATIARSSDRVELYDISNLETGPIFVDQQPVPGTKVNNLMMGGVAFAGNRLAALGLFNGVAVFDVADLSDFEKPSFVTHPSDQQIWPGDSVTFSVDVLGAEPISYQWFHNDGEIPGATERLYTFDAIDSSYAGSYHVVVTNNFGFVESESATLTIDSVVGDNGMLSLAWSIAPGSRTYVSTTHTERSVGVNPVTGNVYIVSRADGNELYVVDGATGDELLQMDTSGVERGTIWLNHVGVADDGVIYAANVVANPSTLDFKLYRWESEGASVPSTVAYAGSLDGSTTRWGDNFAVRGSGTGTQIIISSLNSDQVAVFTTSDGLNFIPTVMTVEGAETALFAHGIAFGEGDTFWGKTGNGGGGTDAHALTRGSFDLNAGTATILNSYEGAVSASDGGPIQVDVANQLLAVLSRNHARLEVYDISNAEANPVHLDTVLFRRDLFGDTALFGAAVFNGDQLTVLSMGNGVMVFNIGDKPALSVPASISVAGTMITLDWTATDGSSYQVTYKNDLGDAEWLNAGAPTVASGSSASYSEDIGGVARRFYRIVWLP